MGPPGGRVHSRRGRGRLAAVLYVGCRWWRLYSHSCQPLLHLRNCFLRPSNAIYDRLLQLGDRLVCPSDPGLQLLLLLLQHCTKQTRIMPSLFATTDCKSFNFAVLPSAFLAAQPHPQHKVCLSSPR